MKLIKHLPPSDILDIGCGAGDLCQTLYEQGHRVHGIDYSQEAVQICHQRLGSILKDNRIIIEQANMMSLTKQYDLIIMCEVLEHIEDDKAAIEKIYQLLKKRGQLILSVPANSSRFGPSDVAVGHYRRYNRNDLIRLLSQCNFYIETIWSYGVPIANITEWIRNIIYARSPMPNKEMGTKQSGINRKIEYHFRGILNDIVFFPFYWLQMAFVNTNLGSGLIIKARKEPHNE